MTKRVTGCSIFDIRTCFDSVGTPDGLVRMLGAQDRRPADPSIDLSRAGSRLGIPRERPDGKRWIGRGRKQGFLGGISPIIAQTSPSHLCSRSLGPPTGADTEQPVR